MDGGRVWQITDCEIAPGMSGGPVLHLRSGVICAVAKTRRKSDSNMGGLIIPATAIRDAFPDVWARNQATAAQDSQWNTLRAALREIADPLRERLTPRERQGLIDAAEQLELRRPDFNALWNDIVGDLGPMPDAFESVTDLAAALADLPESGLDPIAKLFVHLAARLQARRRNVLQGTQRRSQSGPDRPRNSARTTSGLQATGKRRPGP